MSNGLRLTLFFNIFAIALAAATTFWYGGIRKEPMTILLVPIRSHITCMLMGLAGMIDALALAIVIGFLI